MPLTLLLKPVRFRESEVRNELPEDYIYWILVARKDKIEMDDVEFLRLEEESAALIRKLTSSWCSSFHALFDLQNVAQTSVIRIVSARPDLPTWDSTKNITLIGDAAHVPQLGLVLPLHLELLPRCRRCWLKKEVRLRRFGSMKA